MSKKFFVSLGLMLCIAFSFTFCFAADNNFQNAANGVRNFVGGVENTVENAAKDASNTSKDATGSVENRMNNDGRNNDGNNNRNDFIGTNNNNKRGYTTTRVDATDTTSMRFLGMTATGWTWFIIGIAAIAIIAVVWYYSMQFTNRSNNNDNDKLD